MKLRDHEGFSAAYYAQMSGSIQCVELLHSLGSPLHTVATSLSWHSHSRRIFSYFCLVRQLFCGIITHWTVTLSSWFLHTVVARLLIIFAMEAFCKQLCDNMYSCQMGFSYYFSTYLHGQLYEKSVLTYMCQMLPRIVHHSCVHLVWQTFAIIRIFYF